MAYFPNGSSGEAFEELCSDCEHYPICSVYSVQNLFNYDQCDEGQAKLRQCLNILVQEGGVCTMFIESLTPEPGQEEVG